MAVFNDAIRSRRNVPEDVIYCSFNYYALERDAEIDVSSQVVITLKTAFLFGDDKVDVANGWIVPLGTKYRPMKSKRRMFGLYPH